MLFLFLAASGAQGSSRSVVPFPQLCAQILAALSSETKRLTLTQDEQVVIAAMLPELGGRLVIGAEPGMPRWERDPAGALVSRSPSGWAVTVRIVDKLEQPRLVEQERGATLEVPRGFSWEGVADRGRAFFRKAFLGHPLYPFLVDPKGPHAVERERLSEPRLVHREIQRDVIEVGEALLNHFQRVGGSLDQILLAVSPTGTGKSEIVRALLRHRIGQAKRGLFLVMSDHTNIVDQLLKEVNKLTQGAPGELPLPLKIVHWGTGRTKRAEAKTLNELVELARASEEPVVLVTTTASFRTKIEAKERKSADTEDASEFELDEATIKDLRSQLVYWIYDEAHHAGAMKVGRIFEAAMEDNSRAAALLVTATPDARVNQLARGVGFYTYLDQPQSWLVERGKASRTPGDVIRQLRAAFDRGDLVPFEEIRPLCFARTAGEAVYGAGKPDDEGVSRRELLESHYGSLYEQTREALETRSALVSANSQDEALRVAEYLQRRHADKKRVVAIFTSEHEGYVMVKNNELVVTPVKDLLEMFRRGEVHVLVSVDRLNEGVDLPIASVLVDLRVEPNPMSLVQRLGRLTRTAPDKREAQVFIAQEKTKEDLIRELDAKKSETGGSGGFRLTPDRYPVLAVAEYLPRIYEAGRLDFWSRAPEGNGFRSYISGANVGDYQPLLEAVKTTFYRSITAFERVLEALRRNLPQDKHDEWDAGLSQISKKFSPTLLSSATHKADPSPGSAEKVVRVLELYARLRGIEVPDSRFRDPRDFEALLKPFGYSSLSITKENIKSFHPLLEAVKTTFKGSVGNFEGVLEALRRKLPQDKHEKWKDGLFQISEKFSPFLLISAAAEINLSRGSAEQVVRVLELYARLRGIEVPDSRFRDPKDFGALLKPFGYSSFSITKENIESFQPLLEAVKTTFKGSAANFEGVLEALRGNLSQDKHDEWKDGLSQISEKLSSKLVINATLKTDPKPGSAEQVVRVLELYARLRSIEVPESHFRDQKDFEPLLKPFGYSSLSITKENIESYQPLLEAVKTTFDGSAKNFERVLEALRGKLPQEKHDEWKEGLSQISEKFPPRVLTAATLKTDPSPGSAEQVVRVLELYARLRGIEVPDSHFREPKDFERILRPFQSR